MTKFAKALMTGAVVLCGIYVPYDAAEAKTKYRKPAVAKVDDRTNIADCAKVTAEKRNECISRSRPVKGADLYPKAEVKAAAKPVAAKPVAEKAVAKPTAAVPRNKDGTTNVADCAAVDAVHRNECISRARPVKGSDLVPKAAAKVVPAAKAAPAAKPAPAAKQVIWGKDGTTDINDCAKVEANRRNECISRARPVKGSELYAKKGKKAAALDTNKTTNTAECPTVAAAHRNACIGRAISA